MTAGEGTKALQETDEYGHSGICKGKKTDYSNVTFNKMG